MQGDKPKKLFAFNQHFLNSIGKRFMLLSGRFTQAMWVYDC